MEASTEKRDKHQRKYVLPDPTHSLIPSLKYARIVRVAAGAAHSLFVSDLGSVFAVGRNFEGNCGVGFRSEKIMTPRAVKGSVQESHVVSVYAGVNISIAIDDELQCHWWGNVHQNTEAHVDSSASFQHVEGDQLTGLLTGMAVSDAVRAQRLSRIRRSELAWLNSQSFHEVDEGIVLLSSSRAFQLESVKIVSLLGKRISHAAIGSAHIVCIEQGGTVYTAGYNDRGQLGTGNRLNSARFQEISSSWKEGFIASAISCGQQHNLLLIKEEKTGYGQVCSWGSGSLGQLGHGFGTGDCLTVRQIEHLAHVDCAAVACGYNHSVVLSKRGGIYTFGNSEYGQQGNVAKHGRDYSHSSRHFFLPRKLHRNRKRKIVDIQCCENSTILLLQDGGIEGFGWNSHMVMGNRFAASSFVSLSELQDVQFQEISCGQNFILGLAKDSNGCSAFERLWNGDLSDTVIQCTEKTRFHVHKCVMEARAPTFLSACNGSGEILHAPAWASASQIKRK